VDGEPAGEVLDEVGDLDRGARVPHDAGHHVLLGQVARDADGRGFEHRWMGLEGLLHLEGRDVLAASPDDVPDRPTQVR
jgi:hypothetical protein